MGRSTVSDALPFVYDAIFEALSEEYMTVRLIEFVNFFSIIYNNCM